MNMDLCSLIVRWVCDSNFHVLELEHPFLEVEMQRELVRLISASTKQQRCFVNLNAFVRHCSSTGRMSVSVNKMQRLCVVGWNKNHSIKEARIQCVSKRMSFSNGNIHFNYSYPPFSALFNKISLVFNINWMAEHPLLYIYIYMSIRVLFITYVSLWLVGLITDYMLHFQNTW